MKGPMARAKQVRAVRKMRYHNMLLILMKRLPHKKLILLLGVMPKLITPSKFYVAVQK